MTETIKPSLLAPIGAFLRAHPRVAAALVLAAIQAASVGAHSCSPRAGRVVDAVAPLAGPALVAAITDPEPVTVEPVTIGAGGAGGEPPVDPEATLVTPRESER